MTNDISARFDFLQRLDKGGMGQTFLVRCLVEGEGLHQNCEYVLKQIQNKWVREEKAIRRFIREGNIGQNLAHPNVVPIYWTGTTVISDENGVRDPALSIVMKHLRGGTLEERVKRGDYANAPKTAVAVVRGITDGLAYMHRNQVIHHDIKTINIMFDEGGHEPILIDFGLARRTDDQDKVTGTGDFVGTPHYMAPEYLTSDEPGRRPRESHDIFAVGVVLYRMLTQVYPFDGLDSMKIINRIQSGKYKKSSIINPRIDRELEAIVDHCLANNPSDRYATADELLTNLDAYLAGRRVEEPRGRRHTDLFSCGEQELSLYVLVGGNGRTRYRTDADIVAVHRTGENDKFNLPPLVAEGAEARLESKERAAKERKAQYFDGEQMRVLSVDWDTTSDEFEQPVPMRIETEFCSYFQTMLTNSDYDHLLRNGKTVRETYSTPDPFDFTNSHLANPLCVNLSVVTADGYVFYSERGERVGMNPNGVQPAVSGTGNPKLDVRDGRYDPFATAIREAGQEFFGEYELQREDINFFGFARLRHNLCPFLFGEIRTSLSKQEVLGLQPQDRNETRRRIAVKFDCPNVADACRSLLNTMAGTRAHSTIFSLMMSFLYHDTREYYSNFQRRFL
jgi:serine/threonine protein kinase